MTTKTHTLKLRGGSPDQLRISAEVLVQTLDALLDGARQAARFAVEGESSRKGQRPAWVDAVAHLEITSLIAGSAIFSIQAPTLRDSAPERFPGGLFLPMLASEPESEYTAVDCFAGVLAGAISEDRDQVLADRALLDTCARFARAVTTQFTGAELAGLTARAAPVVINALDVMKLESLRDETPSPTAVRVSGRLETISASKPDVILVLTGGETVRGRVDDEQRGKLRDLLGQVVVASGIAQFRPSGRLLVMSIDHLELASSKDVIWEHAPVARTMSRVGLFQPQDEHSGVAAILGTWPGEESDDDLLSALKSLG